MDKSALTPSGMLKEIKLPKQLEKLNQGILPGKNYVDSTKNSQSKKFAFDNTKNVKLRPQTRSQDGYNQMLAQKQ